MFCGPEKTNDLDKLGTWIKSIQESEKELAQRAQAGAERLINSLYFSNKI